MVLRITTHEYNSEEYEERSLNFDSLICVLLLQPVSSACYVVIWMFAATPLPLHSSFYSPSTSYESNCLRIHQIIDLCFIILKRRIVSSNAPHDFCAGTCLREWSYILNCKGISRCTFNDHSLVLFCSSSFSICLSSFVNWISITNFAYSWPSSWNQLLEPPNEEAMQGSSGLIERL